MSGSRLSCARATSGLRRGAARPPHGGRSLTPSLPLVWQLNALRVEDAAAGPGSLAPRPTSCWPMSRHRMLFVHDAELGARLAPTSSAQGWNVVPAAGDGEPPAARPARRGRARRRGEPEQGAAVARRVPSRAAVRRQERPYASCRDGRPLRARLAARATSPRRRRSQAAPAGSTRTASPRWTRSARSRRSATAGTPAPRCWPPRTPPRPRLDPVFLLTDAADWPQHLYRRLGFEAIGAEYEFLKLPLRPRRRS